jgi:hypothetical protein
VRFLLLAYVEDALQLSPEEEAAGDRHIASWAGEMTQRGVRLAGSRLRHESETTTLKGFGDELMVSDGPFAETKEQLAGFELLECDSLDEAIEVASRHPGMKRGTVELRPLLWD